MGVVANDKEAINNMTLEQRGGGLYADDENDVGPTSLGRRRHSHGPLMGSSLHQNSDVNNIGSMKIPGVSGSSNHSGDLSPADWSAATSLSSSSLIVPTAFAEQARLGSSQTSATTTPSSNYFSSVDASCGALTHHSDYTLQTSNRRQQYPEGAQPPLSLNDQQEAEQQNGGRRSVFGNRVEQKYKGFGNSNNELLMNGTAHCGGTTAQQQPTNALWPHHEGVVIDTTPLLRKSVSTIGDATGSERNLEGFDDGGGFSRPAPPPPRAPQHDLLATTDAKDERSSSSNDLVSPLPSPAVPDRKTAALPIVRHYIPETEANNNPQSHYHSLRSNSSSKKHKNRRFLRRNGSGEENSRRSSSKRQQAVHETLHAQSLLLGLAFCAIWTPNNVMAPNLTQISQDFDMTVAQRDLYLGSYCALATGVFSLPIAAGIGFLSDFYSRQRLFCLTVAGGAISAAATGCCQTYIQLFCMRLLNGGFMSGSVPVAFSFLGDLFETQDRNAASSGLTAMMGLGIIAGQVYAGMVGESWGWRSGFFVSGMVTLVFAFLCLVLVQEPERGGKEPVLQNMIKQGTSYERKLTWSSFWHAMRHNESNAILLWQGFFSSLPWGILFVFLNDYLSQERGFSVPDATYMVFLFGVGCTLGGVLGGYWGGLLLTRDTSYLPLFMAATTALGILPFTALLNTHFTNAHGVLGFLVSVSAGLIASLPSVNVRPCLLNVNPPETRGATLTAANLLINVGRGVGPSCITLMGSAFHVDRKFSFNVTLALFWIISAIQLLLLSQTLPKDQESMEADLEDYALQALGAKGPKRDERQVSLDSAQQIFSPCSFDNVSARESIVYMRKGIEEFGHEMHCNCVGAAGETEESSSGSSCSSSGVESGSDDEESDRQQHAKQPRDSYPSEHTPLLA